MSVESAIKGAIEQGLITGPVFPVPALDWRPPGLSPEIREVSDLIYHGPPIPITPAIQQWDDPAWDTRAQLYQDKGFLKQFPNGADDGMVYEIARFQANAGECGFVKYIGTYVRILDGGTPVELDFSDPLAMQDWGVDANFTLRLSPGDDDTLGLAPWTGPVAQTPGYGYPALPYWNDYRFYWGRYANEVWFLVPRRHFLRLFIHVVSGGADLDRALGRLQGYTQPITTVGAEYNVTYGW
jgi:hypothetical protein